MVEGVAMGRFGKRVVMEDLEEEQGYLWRMENHCPWEKYGVGGNE